MGIREEIDLEKADQVVGGCYVTTSMTIGQIIGTDRRLANILNNAGITVTGSKILLRMSLQEAAGKFGVDASVLEAKMNDFLDAN